MSAPPESKLTFDERGVITVGTIQSSNMFDAINVSNFGNEVLAYVKGKSGLRLLLNFENVDYLSSAALTELLRINEAVRATDGAVRLCNLTADIRKVFQITNLDKLFVIHGDDGLESALSRYERSLAVEADDDAWTGHGAGS